MMMIIIICTTINFTIHKVFGDGRGRLICGWLGVVVARQVVAGWAQRVGAPRLGAF